MEGVDKNEDGIISLSEALCAMRQLWKLAHATDIVRPLPSPI